MQPPSRSMTMPLIMAALEVVEASKAWPGACCGAA
jgi:hypothetical protein